MKTNVYIDGFNLFYGCLKKTPYKWLDLSKLCQIMLPPNTIHQIKYFTALVISRPNDPSQPIRQQTYLRALQTIPNLSIIHGHFLSSTVKAPLAKPIAGLPKYVDVLKTEEKGSDVNLASHLLIDGFRNDYDIAVVISNDSDLLSPIQFVKNDLAKQVGVLNPHKHPSFVLTREATFFKQIRESALKQSQFPSSLTDANGTFTKPADW